MDESLATRAVSPRSPHTVALAVAWLLCSGGSLVMLFIGTRATGEFETLRYILHAIYSATLIGYLVRTGPCFANLPVIETPRILRWRGGVWLPVGIVALAFLMALLHEDGSDIVLLLLILGTAGTLAFHWRRIRLHWAVQGALVAIAAYFVGQLPAAHGMIGQNTVALLAGLAAPMYLAGAILQQQTGLGGLPLAEWNLKSAATGWMWGLVLFLPMGMVNAASGSPGGELGWVSEWWMPLFLPWFSGLAEEVWFRLIMVGLVYMLLRPALAGRPRLAAAFAVTFSAVVFGLGHGYNMERLIVTGLLYGLPLAVVFTKRNWEHAVGGHYMINAIPWLLAFLEH